MEQNSNRYLHTDPKEFVSWKNPPSLQELKNNLSDAKPFHSKQVTKIQRHLDFLEGTGTAAIKKRPNRSTLVPKMIRKQAEWRYPALSEPFLSTENLFDAKPVSWEDSKGARQNSLILNNQFNTRIDKVAFIDKYVRTAVDEGTVIVRVGWDYEYETREEEVPIYDFVESPEAAPLMQEIAQLKAENPMEFYKQVPEELQEALGITTESGVPVMPQLVGYETVEKEIPIVNQPTVEVCSYENVIIDPTCGDDFSKANFVIYKFESSISELKKDGIYKNLDQISFTDSALAEPDSSFSKTGFTFEDDARKKVEVFEYWGYWDYDGDGIAEPFVAAWVGETLIRLEEAPFPFKSLPFVVVPMLPRRDGVYGDPDGALIEDNQKIMGALLRGMIDIMARSANGQMGIRKDALDPVNRRRFRNGEDYEFNASVDPRQAVINHTFSEIPASAYNLLQMQNLEAEALTGVKAFSQGIGSQSLGEVAAGIKGALDAASKREASILRRLASGLIKIGRMILAMNAEFLSEKEFVRITNDEFVPVERDDLAGNFDLTLTIATAEENQMKAQELAFMLQTMGNNLPFDMVKLILAEIARLRKMPDLARMIEKYEPQPDPVQQQLQKIELETAIADLEEKRAKVQQHFSDAQLKQAKVQETLAKTEHLQSDTDLKNLDYVEQESGVKQERDLEKMRTQSEAQARTKIIEYKLKEQTELKKYMAGAHSPN